MAGFQLAVVPFGGFYNTLNEYAIESQVGSIFAQADGFPMHDLVERAYDNGTIDLPTVRGRYAEAYSRFFGERVKEFLPSLRHKDLTRDRLYAEISKEDVARMHENTPRELLADEIRLQFEPRPGWCPYYSSNIDKWPEDISKWDHNEVNTLMMAHLKHKGIDYSDFEKWEEKFYHAMSEGSNEVVIEWLYEAAREPAWGKLLEDHAERLAEEPAVLGAAA